MKIKSKNYYGLVNILKKNDKRIPKYVKQFKTRGYDDTETWNLYYTISKFILPRLKRFEEVNPCYPGNLTMKEWKNIINKMISAHKLIVEDKVIYSDEEDKKIEEGLDLFHKWYRHLWW